ncbi:MAG: pilus assembly protein TadG-related protein [Novosphingobium sp.]|uniref:pilus assembly protein TadG-related protein n=1 Tax=Novosphingobium sp. TaxID=1874826 RepID=UPI0032B92D9E
MSETAHTATKLLNFITESGSRIGSGLRRMIADKAGVSFATMALMLPLMVGFVGLAIDVGVWQVEKRAIQGAADRAAYSAATSALAGASKAQATTEGKATMASAGFAHGAASVNVTVNNPASTGTYSTDPTSWEVIVSKPQRLYFAGIFLSSAPSVSVRAVAVKGKTASPGCILSLDGSAAGATTFTNNAQVPNDKCAVYTNSASGSALLCSNNCNITSDTYTVGGNSVGGNSSLSGAINKTGIGAAPDPYASVPVPSSASMTCTATALLNIASSTTINPGVFCGGIAVGAGKVLTMSPGTYYIKKKFNMGSASTLNATGGVTIVLLDDACLGDGTCIKEKGLLDNITINLTAPTTGTFAGIALYAQGTTMTRQEFSNNVALNIQGALYAPGDLFSFHNNSLFSNAKCAQVIGRRVNFENNATMGSNCDNTGVKQIVGPGGGPTKTKLVE